VVRILLRHSDGLLTWTVSLEARARQSSLVVSQIPKPNAIPCAPHLHRHRADGNLSADLGNDYDTALSEFNVEVRIERSIIRDIKPADEEATEQELYSPSRSDWEKATGSDSDV
jgi:hypothetical protein